MKMRFLGFLAVGALALVACKSSSGGSGGSGGGVGGSGGGVGGSGGEGGAGGEGGGTSDDFCTCACTTKVAGSGCEDVCTMGDNNTTNPNFCDGSTALSQCKMCLQNSCGWDGSQTCN